MHEAYEELNQVEANFVPLSPLSFIERAAKVYPDRTSIIHGDRHYTWSQTYARTRQLASALSKIGIGKGDTVAIMGANTPETYEAHEKRLKEAGFSQVIPVLTHLNFMTILAVK